MHPADYTSTFAYKHMYMHMYVTVKIKKIINLREAAEDMEIQGRESARKKEQT